MNLPYPTNIYVVKALQKRILPIEETIEIYKKVIDNKEPLAPISKQSRAFFEYQIRNAIVVIAQLREQIEKIKSSENFLEEDLALIT